MSERFDIDVGYRDPWDPPDPEPAERPDPSEYMDDPEPCPMGCGFATEDPYGGPCSRCWEQA